MIRACSLLALAALVLATGPALAGPQDDAELFVNCERYERLRGNAEKADRLLEAYRATGVTVRPDPTFDSYALKAHYCTTAIVQAELYISSAARSGQSLLRRDQIQRQLGD